MLLKQTTLKGIQEGTISVVFRKWRRPSVKAGGTLLTRIGQLAIEAVDIVPLEDISASEAMESGFSSLESLKSLLLKRSDGEVYRIRLALVGPDPRIALRMEIPDALELESIIQRLIRKDSQSASGPWILRALKIIRQRPGERAANLAADFGQDKPVFKTNVRKLKGMGLTESLDVGYRLSPRGRAVLDALEDEWIKESTRCWVETVVIGLNLCPFAKREMVNNSVRFSVTAAESEGQLLVDLQNEMELLSGDDAVETTLLIHPQVLQSFSDYNQFLSVADNLLRDLDLEGIFQVASFHPSYQFVGTEPGDAQNYTNRSPYPMLHLLREESLEHAIANHPDSGLIPKRNVKHISNLGGARMRSLLQACIQHEDVRT